MPPSSFIMPLPTGGYHVTTAPPDAKVPAPMPADGGAADESMADADGDDAAPMEEE